MAHHRAQHFVPQFYLRRFGSGRQIGLCNLHSREFVDGASIRKQCQRTNLYGADLALEKELGSLEFKASQVIREVVLAERAPKQGSDAHCTLIAFVATLWFRTPAAVAEAESIGTAMMRAMLRESPSIAAETKKHLDDLRLVQTTPMPPLRFAGRVVPLMLDLSLAVVVNESQTDFITSDAPVAFYNQWSSAARRPGGTGFASRGLQIFLPLDSRHLLLFYDPRVYVVGGRKETRVVFSDPRTAKALNKLQIMFAHHNLFYSPEAGGRAAVSGLPLRKHGPRSEVARANVAIGVNNPNSALIHLYTQRPEVGQLEFSFSRIRKDSKQVPNELRWNQFRPDARAMDLALNGRRHDDRREPTDTHWRVPIDGRSPRR